MQRTFQFAVVAAFLLALPAMDSPLCAQQPKGPSPHLVEATVTAVGPNGSAPRPLGLPDISVHQDNFPRPVVRWIPAKDSKASLEFVILIDDDLNPGLGLQFRDISQFLRRLPINTRVAVAYASYGSADMRQGFTTDREAAIHALRLPLGNMGESNGVYYALSDLIKKWPPGAGRREVLLVSTGIDLSFGFEGSRPMNNIPLEQAISLAQRHNVTVYSIYASGTGLLSRNSYLILNGQSCLSELSLETGGDSFFLGDQTPVSFQPYLQTISKLLDQQYLLTFRAQLPRQAGMHKLHVSTEVSHVELLAPAQVYLPAAK